MKFILIITLLYKFRAKWNSVWQPRPTYNDLRDVYIKKYPKIKEIHIATCPVNFELSKSFSWGPVVAGHAHIYKSDPYYHHICIAHKSFITDSIIAHEYAHILTDADHGRVWERELKKLGFTAGLETFARSQFQ